MGSWEPDPDQIRTHGADSSRGLRPQAHPLSWPARQQERASSSNESSGSLWAACPGCSRDNPAGNRFCGYCGHPLSPSPATAAQRLSELAQTRPPGMAPPALPGEELQFLRLQTLAEAGEPDSRGHHRWLYLVASLAAILAGFLAFNRYYRPPIALPRVAASTESAPFVEPPAETARGDEMEPQQLAPPLRTAKIPDEPPRLKDEVEAIKPAARVVNTSTRPRLGSDNGATELAEAERFLQTAGKAAQAAPWLWKAVAKQNPDAAVLLADLYARGEGVPLSCGQAKVLLTAAARQGNAAAQQKLRGLDSACK